MNSSYTHLSDAQFEQVRDAFNIFDKNKDGTISSDELRSVMKSLGLNPSETEIMDMIDSADVDKNGVIDINEFISLMPALTGDDSFAPQDSSLYPSSYRNKVQTSEEEELRRAFKEFDANGDGFISAEELADVMESIERN